MTAHARQSTGYIGRMVDWQQAHWRSEAGLPAPQKLQPADDGTTADQALRLLRQGKFLLYEGDFVNARQLLAALARRLGKRRRDGGGRAAADPAAVFRTARDLKAEEHRVLSRLLVPVDPAYKVPLRRGPEVADACAPVWGPADGKPSVVSLRELLGMMGAAEWRKRGLEIEGLPGRLHPHYGVFTPTRGEYPALLAKAPSPAGKRVFDLGTGTGVLGLLLLARGAKEVVATDLDPRAVACAEENAGRLGFSDRFRVQQADLFPPKEARADLIVSNPPWLPERPRTALDRAVYDEEGAFLRGLLSGLSEHLTPGGEAWIILSDLAERLGLRPEGQFEALVREAGLAVRWTQEVRPRHGKASDLDDPLHAARAAEVVRLWCVA